MNSEDKKALQEKLFRRLNTRVSEAAQGVRQTSQDLFRQIEELSTELGRRVEQEAAEVVGSVADELSLARDTVTRAEERYSSLARAVRSILEQKDQLSVLESLLEGALLFCDGSVLFVLKDVNLGAWRAGGRIEGSRAKSVHFPLSSKNSLARSLREREALRVTGDYSDADNSLFDEFGAGRPAGFVAVPLVIREKAQAVLLGAGFDDQNSLGEPELEAFKVLAAAATSAIRNIQGRGGQEPGDDRVASRPVRPAPRPSPPVPSPPAEPPARESGAPAPAGKNRSRESAPPSPSSPSADDTAAHVPPETHRPTPPPVKKAPPPVKKTPPPVKKTPATVEQLDKPLSPWFTPTSRTSSLRSREVASERRNGFGVPHSETDHGGDDSLGPEEQELHDDARRFARLLVSEIKLYNEAKVTEGREERDLYHRLRSDIERSRQMYNERVPPSIAAKSNYFMDELVSILAEGDRSILGM